MSSASLVESLHNSLKSISAHPCPHVAGPKFIKKRASVALIIRIQPTYSHWPSPIITAPKDIDAFFAQDWVQHGEPQVLFIKRAARKGDRWTSHIALPGGRRDPEDVDDQAAAVRETIEEVGIDLYPGHAIAVGSLPQRVVTTSWGRVPLMVLCPYIYLLTTPHLAPLRLQPTEVASTHWVPLSALLSPHNRTSTYQDVSSRLANQDSGLLTTIIRSALGQMQFSAIRLLPAESLHCAASPAESTPSPPSSNILALASNLFSSPQTPPPQTQPPLLLWGLTLGVLADFLDTLPPHNALQLWKYPTFTPWDVRLVIWAVTYKFKKRRIRDLEVGRVVAMMAVPAAEEGLDDMRLGGEGEGEDKGEAAGEGKEEGKEEAVGQDTEPRIFPRPHVSSAVGNLLDGYYPLVRKAVAATLIGRAALIATVVVILLRRRQRQRRQ